MIKLLALDLDGTTLNSRGQITGRQSRGDSCGRGTRRAGHDRDGQTFSRCTAGRTRSCVECSTDHAQRRVVKIRRIAKKPSRVPCSRPKRVSRSFVSVKTYGGDALVSTDPHGHGTLLYDRVSDDNIPLRKYLRWSETLHGGESDARASHMCQTLEDILHEHEIVHISFSGSCDAMSAMLVGA